MLIQKFLKSRISFARQFSSIKKCAQDDFFTQRIQDKLDAVVTVENEEYVYEDDLLEAPEPMI